ncbi:MAG: hypothetical protein HC836_47500 [Richelia sp. RM2_1_2]|nr:hypothetical protein [Richelia sp. RM2_1_2]
MKIELSGEEKAIIAVYLQSFEAHYRNEKNSKTARKFSRVRNKFLLNSEKVDLKKLIGLLLLKL